VCGFTGEVEVFDTGCPNCGYSAPEKPSEKPQSPDSPEKTSAHQAVEALPLWVYIVTGIVFLGVLALLYYALSA
jgi:hypothetical protein